MERSSEDSATILWELGGCLQRPRVILYNSFNQFPLGEGVDTAISGLTLEQLCLEGTLPLSHAAKENRSLMSMSPEVPTVVPDAMDSRCLATPPLVFGAPFFESIESPLHSGNHTYEGTCTASEVSIPDLRCTTIKTNVSFFSLRSIASGIELPTPEKGAQRLIVRCQVVPVVSLREMAQNIAMKEDFFTSSHERNDVGDRTKASKDVSGETLSWSDASGRNVGLAHDALVMMRWNEAMITSTSPTLGEADGTAGSEKDGDQEQLVGPSPTATGSEDKSQGDAVIHTEEETIAQPKTVYVRLASPISAAWLGRLFREFPTPLGCPDAHSEATPLGKGDLWVSDFANPDKFASRDEQPQNEIPRLPGQTLTEPYTEVVQWAPPGYVPHGSQGVCAKLFASKAHCVSDKILGDRKLDSGFVNECKGCKNQKMRQGPSSELQDSDREALACLFPAIHHGRVFNDADAFVAHCHDLQDHLLWCEHLPLFPLQVVPKNSPPLPPMASKATTRDSFYKTLIGSRHGSSGCLTSAHCEKSTMGLEMSLLVDVGGIGDILLNCAVREALGHVNSGTNTTTTSWEPLDTAHPHLLHWFSLLYTELVGWTEGSNKHSEEGLSFVNISGKERLEPNGPSRALPSWVGFVTALGVAGRMVRQLYTMEASTPCASEHTFAVTSRPAEGSSGDFSPRNSPPLGFAKSVLKPICNFEHDEKRPITAEESTFARKELRKAPCNVSLPRANCPFADWTSLCSVAKFIYWAVDDCWSGVIAAATALLSQATAPGDIETRLDTDCESAHHYREKDVGEGACRPGLFEDLFCQSVCVFLAGGRAATLMHLPTNQEADHTSEGKTHDAHRCNKKTRNESFHQDTREGERENYGGMEDAQNGMKAILQRFAAALAVPLAFIITKCMRRKELSDRLQQLSIHDRGMRARTPANVSTKTDGDGTLASFCATPAMVRDRNYEDETQMNYRNTSFLGCHIDEPDAKVAAEDFALRRSVHRGCSMGATTDENTLFLNEGQPSRKKRSRSTTEASLESSIGDGGDVLCGANSNEEAEEAVNSHQRFMDLLLLLLLSPVANTSDV